MMISWHLRGPLILSGGLHIEKQCFSYTTVIQKLGEACQGSMHEIPRRASQNPYEREKANVACTVSETLWPAKTVKVLLEGSPSGGSLV